MEKRWVVFGMISFMLAVLPAGCGASTKEQLAKDEAALKAKDADLKSMQDKMAASDKKMSELMKEKDTCSGSLAQCNKDVAELASLRQELSDALKAELEEGNVEVKIFNGRVQLVLKDKILYATCSTEIHKKGKEVLMKAGSVLKKLYTKLVLVEGHTDNVPLTKKCHYKSNWELSFERAMTGVNILLEAGVDPKNLEGSGASQYQPIATNDTEEGRSKNRRLEIELLPNILENPETTR